MYYIWISHYKNGKFVGSSVYPKSYKRKGYAKRVARQKLCGARVGQRYEWIVSETNPWLQKD